MDLLRFFNMTPSKPDAAEAVRDPRALRGDNDAIATAVASFLTRTGLFDREAYLRTYPDVAKSGLDPLHHFVRVGIHLGRQFTTLPTIARLWREVLREVAATPPPVQLADPKRFHAAIYVSSRGNFFMREIADVLKAGFDDLGVRADVRDETGQPADATHHIVIAPHEFFVLGEGKRWANDVFVSRAIVFSTEQIQTQWFARSLVFLLRAKAVVDMNEQNAAILRKAGVRAAAVQPGYSAGFAPLSKPRDGASLPALASLTMAARNFDAAGAPLAARPLDVLFLGSHSPRRAALLAGYAEKFSGLNAFIYYTRMTVPLDPANNPTASTNATAALLQRSKILLNVHRDEYTYFEWWRLMQAFWLQTVVVTEPCFPHTLYKPGTHYFEEAPRHIPHLIDWLARSADGQARAEDVRRRAFEDFAAHSTAKSAALTLLQAGGAQ
ncbi:MAG: hypothetical protein HOP13_04190 [Alphaproteobacteria bacterium]|nr:hypothetical protein [Alphaproteobacteria bacterium]